MYGKFFASTFEGSMYGAGPGVFALWAYVISHTVNSRVEVNPVAVAPKLGMTVEEVGLALAYLEAPDPRSRSKTHDGRRMVREGEYAFFIPNHRIYLTIKNSEDLREYNARKQREYRARRKNGGGNRQEAETGLGELEKWVENGEIPEARRERFKDGGG